MPHAKSRARWQHREDAVPICRRRRPAPRAADLGNHAGAVADQQEVGLAHRHRNADGVFERAPFRIETAAMTRVANDMRLPANDRGKFDAAGIGSAAAIEEDLQRGQTGNRFQGDGEGVTGPPRPSARRPRFRAPGSRAARSGWRAGGRGR